MAVIVNFEMAEANVRLERMFWIPSLVSVDSAPRDFRDFCEDMPEKRDAPLYQSLPRLLTCIDEDDFDPEWVVEDLLRGEVGGFIVQAATPVLNFYGEGKSHSYSWGHYYTEWLHAPDEASIPAVLVAWAIAHHERDMAEAKAGAA